MGTYNLFLRILLYENNQKQSAKGLIMGIHLEITIKNNNNQTLDEVTTEGTEQDIIDLHGSDYTDCTDAEKKQWIKDNLKEEINNQIDRLFNQSDESKRITLTGRFVDVPIETEEEII